ncbi:MAG TPA: type IV toxin-antitoxin system AbiEi family antitoxin [Patescibacteria group bacterium]|nr:type IV toxin-antitoxin system AbiEi family antitoxin [Patescibacteria group bacterium]
MMLIEEGLVRHCLERLRDLPFVDKALLLPGSEPDARGRDGRIRIITPFTTREFDLEVKRTHLTRGTVDGVLAQAARRGQRPWILFAPHVGRPLGQYLNEQRVNYVDVAGNCRLQIDRRHMALIEGRPPERAAGQGRGIGAPGFRILFALLVKPGLLDAPVRQVAEAAGVATATAANRLTQLRKDGLVDQRPNVRVLTAPRRMLDLWLKGYETLVRPKLLIGRFRTEEQNPRATEHLVEKALRRDTKWAFGAGAAAHRMTGYYRGPETVVHVQHANIDVAKRLHALRAEDGPLTLIQAPGPVAFESVVPHTVAPLLVYTELILAGDKRAREAATEIERKYLRATLESAP